MRYELIIGFITYGKSTAKYLPYFLPSLEKQIFRDYNIIIFDNTESLDNENIVKIKNFFPETTVMGGDGNMGFARVYNKMIDKAVEIGAEYFLAINSDMILEPDVIEKMIKAMESNSELGSVCPKIMQWQFADNKKTNIIDSCGIQLKSGLRFVDVGQGQVGNGQYDDVEILGPSGAAGMYRINALEKIKINNQYFDELMFMYKEDCDLAYRLFLAGFQSKCVNDAIVHHDRTAHAKGESNLQVALNRKSKSRQVKKWSFLNQQIIFIKYWRQQSFWNKLAIIWYELKMILFILLFEQYLFFQFFKLWKMRKNIRIYKRL